MYKMLLILCSIILMGSLLVGCSECCNEEEGEGSDTDGVQQMIGEAVSGAIEDIAEGVPCESYFSGSFRHQETREGWRYYGTTTITSCEGTVEIETYFVDEDGGQEPAITENLKKGQRLSHTATKEIAGDEEKRYTEYCVEMTGSVSRSECYS